MREEQFQLILTFLLGRLLVFSSAAGGASALVKVGVVADQPLLLFETQLAQVVTPQSPESLQEEAVVARVHAAAMVAVKTEAKGIHLLQRGEDELGWEEPLGLEGSQQTQRVEQPKEVVMSPATPRKEGWVAMVAET